MIEALSWKLAKSLKAQNPDHPSSVAILKHSISFLLNTGFTIGTTLLVTIFTGKFIEAVIVLISYATLRQFSGGVHLKSGTLCVVISSAGATVLSFSDFGKPTVTVINCIALALAAIYAPSKLETRISKGKYPRLKVISIAIIASNFFFNSPVLASTFLVQSLTLIRRGGENR